MFLGVCLESWMSGGQMEWAPCLQAPELTGTVRFYKVLLQSPSNLHLPCFSSISPSLVQVFLQKWSNRLPQDQQLLVSGLIAAVLCFQDFCFPSVVNPTLAWFGIDQMFRPTMSFLLESHPCDPGAGVLGLGFSPGS